MSRNVALAALWITASLISVLLICQPISIEAQFVTGIAAIAVMTVTWLISKQGIWRQIFLALGTAVVIRYVYWRTTSTLPPIDEPINFVPGFILYAMEMFSVLMLFISLFIIVDPLQRPRARQLPDDKLPTAEKRCYGRQAAPARETVTPAAASHFQMKRRISAVASNLVCPRRARLGRGDDGRLRGVAAALVKRYRFH